MSSSDSSEDEDLSRFKDAVDTTFINKIKNDNVTGLKSGESKDNFRSNLKSERYLDESTHYNDIKVPPELQKKIGQKISALIDKKIEFVEPVPKKFKRKIKGGVKLFKDSEDFLSCVETADSFTEAHNIEAKKLKLKNKSNENDEDKLKSVAVSGEYVLSKEEIKCWKSRRKEKVFKYKSNGKGVLTAME